MTDPEGRLVAGTTPPSRGAASRASAATDLPWTLHVFEPSAGTAPAEPPRRTLLLFVIASVAALVATGWYFIWRSVSREVRLARLQSDFVAAVSHEFRSPLTSLRHIGDLLVEDRFSSEEHKKRSYAILVNQTDRLGRLVEGVLDFARFEAGTAALRLAPTSLAETVRTVVADFRNRPGGGGRTIALAAPLPDAVVNADRDALARAIWNLLDNAAKYSPPESTIWIAVRTTPGDDSVAVSIRDEGIGIPPHEQRAGVRSVRAWPRGNSSPYPRHRDRTGTGSRDHARP
jgi:signal transduction histidine kinase